MVEAVVSGGSQLVPLGILVIDFERPEKTSGFMRRIRSNSIIYYSTSIGN